MFRILCHTTCNLLVETAQQHRQGYQNNATMLDVRSKYRSSDMTHSPNNTRLLKTWLYRLHCLDWSRSSSWCNIFLWFLWFLCFSRFGFISVLGRITKNRTASRSMPKNTRNIEKFSPKGRWGKGMLRSLKIVGLVAKEAFITVVVPYYKSAIFLFFDDTICSCATNSSNVRDTLNCFRPYPFFVVVTIFLSSFFFFFFSAVFNFRIRFHG